MLRWSVGTRRPTPVTGVGGGHLGLFGHGLCRIPEWRCHPAGRGTSHAVRRASWVDQWAALYICVYLYPHPARGAAIRPAEVLHSGDNPSTVAAAAARTICERRQARGTIPIRYRPTSGLRRGRVGGDRRPYVLVSGSCC